MTDTGKSNLRGAGLALVAFALFATHDVVVKSLGQSYLPFQIIFFSVLMSFPWVIFSLIGDAEKGTLRPVHPWWSALRTVCILISGSCAFYAFSTVPLAQVYAALFAAPLIITILSIPILGERVGIHRWSAVILGLAGVLIALRPGSGEIGLGHAAAVASALFSAMASVVVRKIGRDERSAVLMLFPMLANFVVMGALMPFVYEPMPVEHLGGLAFMSILAFVAGMLLISAYRTAAAAVVAPMQYSQIIWAAIYGTLLFSETPDRMTWIGAGLIIASGLYIVLRETFGGRSTTTPVLRTKARASSGTSPRTKPLEKIVPIE
ncbi:DMT family transporter [Ovoidimarina sediminis]|uniref:DMT family transporter n=1 Tax=Ovoidimarina sediminis TaxID=3079856 RepID=UPI0029085739|nr:DMT family transporter [Rhodophyticola sp. MJ-SS7]MDU8942615.1 DMT family transporter [Rhodophyticola sp. MJ-SS7]